MRAVAVVVGVLAGSQASAFDAGFRSEFSYKPEAAWQTEAQSRIRKVSSKVLDTMWSQRISLWVEVKNDRTDWEKAGMMFCRTLEGAGKPEKEFVRISFWRDDEIVAKVSCD